MDHMRRLIIGVGSEYQGDDGVGRHVARKLQDTLPPDITVLEESGDAANLMEAWKGADYVIIIDAMVSGAAPGTILRLDATETPLPRELFPHFSTHTYSVAESIELARFLGRLPSKIIIYGIEGKQFRTNGELSLELLQKTDEVIDILLQEINI
jgi:hydrogenase maturation protease